MSEIGGWEVVRQAVRQRIGPAAFGAWIEPLEGCLEGDCLVVRCPDRFSRDWIRGRYGSVIESAAGGSRVEYSVAPAEPEPPSPRPRRGGAPAPERSPIPAADASFESFVSGPGNALALEAARALARGSAGRCSPLVLAGGSGLGKTHLCRAIRAQVGSAAVYRSSEAFTEEVTSALRSGKIEGVRRRYRRELNVLILEDVQFLAGKRATQVELFHTLDSLVSQGKSVVFTADRPPHEIDELQEALRSRMTSGLVACITRPELETRRAILRDKAAAGGVRIPDDCLETLAQRPVSSVRDLVGGLNQVVARASLLRQPVTQGLVAEALLAVDVASRPRSLDEIIDLVAGAYGVSREDLCSRSRRRRVVRPRQFAMYLSRRYTEASLGEIGRALSRDHTSVIYAVDVVERRIVERPQLRYELEALATRLEPRPGRRTRRTPRRGP